MLSTLILNLILADSHSRVSWQERSRSYELSLSLVHKQQKSMATISISGNAGKVTQLILSLDDSKLEGNLAALIPIRVVREAAPQVLVVRFQGNLNSYDIYSCSQSKIVPVWHYETHHEDSVAWVTSGNKLSAIRTLDRLAVPETEFLSHPARGDQVWVRQREYSFQRIRKAWKLKDDCGVYANLNQKMAPVVSSLNQCWFKYLQG